MNLLKAGHELVVYNRTRSKADHLIAAGAVWADSPAEAFNNSAIIITMLENPSAVESVFEKFSYNQEVRSDKIWIDCSTVNPSFTRKISKRAAEVGIRLIDAPVAGSKGPAENGELVFLTGGSEQDLDKVAPLFEAMGKKHVYIGDTGQGSAMKLVINLMLAQSMLAFSEAMALGLSMRIPQQLLMDVLLNTPVCAPIISAVRPKLESGNEEVNFPLRLIRKDLQLVSKTAHENSVALPSANIAREVFTDAMNAGMSEADFTAIFKFLTERNK